MSRLRRTRRSRGDEGATAVEFALVVPVLLSLLFGALAVGLHVTYGAVAEHSVREGLRTATVRTKDACLPPNPGEVAKSACYGNLAAVTSRVNSTAPNFLPKADLVTCKSGTINPIDCNARRVSAQGEEVEVTVKYTVPGVSGALGAIPFVGNSLEGLTTVERTAKGRRE